MTTDTTPSPRPNIRLRLAALGETTRGLAPRLWDLFVHAVLQVRLLKKAYPGVMHFLIFWGVCIQVAGTAINLMQMKLFTPFELTWPRQAAYLAYELVMDLAGVAILLGVLMAAFRRAVLQPKALETRWDDAYALVLLGFIPILGFTLEGLRLLSASPAWAGWSFFGNLITGMLRGFGMTPEMAMSWHPYLFWTHIFVALLLVASLPFTKLRHLVTAPLNALLHPLRAAGELEKIENIDTAETLGVGKINEFASLQLLSFDACLNCGRCEEACPAEYSGMPLSPRVVVQSLRAEMVGFFFSNDGKDPQEIVSPVVPEQAIWSCTTCGVCLARCPVLVNPLDEIVDLRRYQALTTGKLPKSVADALRNFERQGNPWGMPPTERLAWADGMGVRELAPGEKTDVLFYVGCAAAYDQRNRKVAQAFVRILQKAKVDFAILGLDEVCCGETARRLGHEYLFQAFAQQNIAAFKQVKFSRIVTTCPHCYNTLKNEYPQMGGEYPVQHYTEFLAQLSLPLGDVSAEGKGTLNRVAYHDSCYLGRYNQVYAQPRALLRQAKVSLVEMPRRGENSFCCGGGGGQMWMETDPDTRINHRRLQEALKTKAGIVATACPYCLLMFDDAIRSKNKGDVIQVMDIAEILDKSD